MPYVQVINSSAGVDPVIPEAWEGFNGFNHKRRALTMKGEYPLWVNDIAGKLIFFSAIGLSAV